MKQPAQSLPQLPTLTVKEQWQNVFSVVESKTLLESTLQDYLYTRRWFGGKARTIQSARIVEVIPISYQDTLANIVWLQVEYTEGEPETYTLLLGYVEGEQVSHLKMEPSSVVAHLQVQGKESGMLFEATADEDFLRFPLEAIAHNQRYEGKEGQLVATKTDLFNELSGGTTDLKPSLIKAEQSNTSIIYGDRLILKFFRKIEEGINPDFEIGRFLSHHGYVEHFASIAGALEYQRSKAELTTIATLQEFIYGSRDAWKYTLSSLQDFFKKVLEHSEITDVPIPSESPLDLQAAKIPELAAATIGTYLTDAHLLGQRTAELHVALASDSDNPDFAPEPFTSLFQQSVYQNLGTLTKQNFLLLKKRLDSLSPQNQQLAQALLNCQDGILERFELVMKQPITALRTRCHGDYHLGQVLYTGKDFVIIDFEGEPARSLNERRMKLSPLRDVAGMLQSFNYAANMGLRNEVESETLSSENLLQMKQWAQFWGCWVSAAFLNAYLETAKQGSFLPKTGQELQILLDIYLFEKAAYELGYELNNRPGWVDIPLQRLLQL